MKKTTIVTVTIMKKVLRASKFEESMKKEVNVTAESGEKL